MTVIPGSSTWLAGLPTAPEGQGTKGGEVTGQLVHRGAEVDHHPAELSDLPLGTLRFPLNQKKGIISPQSFAA